MSIGELLNLYRESELDIHPEFQRVFRWGIEQKSRLIESLLLGIPLPSLYVSTNHDGVWEVIDGVQRLSTIFEFMGELQGPIGDGEQLQPLPALALEATKHLPSLKGVTFEAMDQALRLEFKRTRLDIKVLAREQGASTGKFDLFERLNTYGEPLSPQELRNCILVSLNSQRFKWLKALSQSEGFRSCVLLSDSQIAEKYDMDLALRFLTLRDAVPKDIGDVHEFLRDRMEAIATSTTYDQEAEEGLFSAVFKFLDQETQGNAFRPWNAKTNAFRGGFSLAAFEGLGLAMGRHWPEIQKIQGKFDVIDVVKSLWNSAAYAKSFSGLRARERMVRVVPVADEIVKKAIKAANATHAKAKKKPHAAHAK
jgi:hypothetical protein